MPAISRDDMTVQEILRHCRLYLERRHFTRIYQRQAMKHIIHMFKLCEQFANQNHL